MRPAPTPKSTPPRTLPARARRALFRVVGITATACVAGYLVLHIGAAIALRKVAAGAGIPHLDFSVRSVNPWHLTLGNVSTPNGPLIGEIHAEFSPLELLSSKVRTVRITGLTLTVDATDLAHPRVEGLPDFAASATTRSTGSPAASSSPIKLPDVFELRAAVLNLKLPGHHVTIPLTASYNAPASRTSTATSPPITARASLGGDDITVTLRQSGPAWTGELTGALNAGTLVPLLPPGVLPAELVNAGLTVGGQADVFLSFDTAAGTAVFRASTTDATARIPTPLETIDITRIALDAAGRYGPVEGLSGSVDLGLVATATYLDGPTRVRVRSQIASGPTPASMRLAASAFISGPALSAEITDVVFSTLTTAATADVKLAFTPPPRLLGQLRRAGLSLGPVEPVVLSGTLAYDGVGQFTADLNDLSAAAREVILPGTLTLGQPRLSLARLQATADLSGHVDATLSGLQVSALSITGLPDVKLALSTPARAEAESITIRAKTTPNGLDYQILSGDIVLVLPPTAIDHRQAQLTAAQGVLHLTGALTPGQVDLRLMPDSQLQIASAKAPDDAWSTGPATFVLTERIPRPTTQSTTPPSTLPALPLLTRTGTNTHLAFRAEARDVAATSRGVSALVGRFVTNVELGLGATTTLAGYARVERTDITHDALNTTFKGLTVSLPFSLDAATPPSGTFTIASVERAGQTLPGLKGELWISRRAAYAGLTWELLRDTPVKASAEIQFLPDKTLTDIRAWVPEFDFRESAELRKLLPPELADLDVTGRFAAELRYYVDGTTVSRWGEIEIKDAALKSKSLDADLSGVSGRVWTRSFSPLETTPGQRLSVKSARLGKLAVSEGAVDFRIDPGNIVFIESALFGFGGGELSARGFRVDPAKLATDLVLYADGISVEDLARTASADVISGSGKLYARLPVSIKWPETLSFGGGYIYAEAGGDAAGKGSLQFGTYAEKVADLAGSTMGSDPRTATLRTRLIDTLKQYGFDSLSLELTRPEGKPLTATLRTSGTGPKLAGGQGLDLTFNVTGLEDLIAAGLFIKRKSGGIDPFAPPADDIFNPK